MKNYAFFVENLESFFAEISNAQNRVWSRVRLVQLIWVYQSHRRTGKNWYPGMEEYFLNHKIEEHLH